MNIPEELRYTKSHEWLKEEDGVCTVGLTDFAQHALGDIVFVNLPQEGDHDKRMNDCLPPILFSAIFKLLKVLPDTELDAC